MKILIADDDHSLRALIKQHLETAGHEVTEVSDGGEAFQVLVVEGIRVDAIITDMRMPKLSGAEILQAINCGRLTPPTLLHSSESSGYMSNRERIDDLAEFASFFEFAQFHRKGSDFLYIDNFLKLVAGKK